LIDAAQAVSSGDQTELSVFVIVAVLNRAATLQRCLDSIAVPDQSNNQQVLVRQHRVTGLHPGHLKRRAQVR